ncbi:MAG: hypothetical protein ACTSWQ_01585 [Candidatus Thorarchaeota archaeon]
MIPRKLRFMSIILVLLISVTTQASLFDSNIEEPNRVSHLSANAWDDRPFSSQSPFNVPIPNNAEIDPNSDAIINNLVGSMSGEEIFVGVDKWSVPVFFANSSAPRYDVDITDEWPIWDIMEDVPIPDNAVPDPEDDGHMCIVDNDTLIEYDFWRANKTQSGWTAEWGNKISLGTDGIYQDSWGARASGFALTAGLIFPQEITQGIINHALVYSTDSIYVKGGGPVRPATTSDGTSDEPLAIPEGTRLQLNPSINLDNLELSEAARTIAQAMQNYGMFLCDLGGGHQVYAYNPINSGYSWGSILPTDDDGISWIFETNFSITDFHILKIGQQIPNPDNRTTLPPYILPTVSSSTSSTNTESALFSVEVTLVIVGFVLVICILVILRKRHYQ